MNHTRSYRLEKQCNIISRHPRFALQTNISYSFGKLYSVYIHISTRHTPIRMSHRSYLQHVYEPDVQTSYALRCKIYIIIHYCARIILSTNAYTRKLVISFSCDCSFRKAVYSLEQNVRETPTVRIDSRYTCHLLEVYL